MCDIVLSTQCLFGGVYELAPMERSDVDHLTLVWSES